MKLRICMVQPPSNLSIPLRTQLSEVYGRFLVERGNHIVIIIQSKIKRHYHWNGIEIYEAPVRNILYQIRLIYKILKTQHCNILQIRNAGLDGLIAILFKHMFHIPLVYQYTMPNLEYLKFLKRTTRGLSFLITSRYLLADFFQLRLMRSSNCILTISDSMTSYLINRNIPGKKIITFPDGASIDRFVEKSDSQRSKKKKQIITYIGTLDKLRNLGCLIHAFDSLVKQRSQVQLVIVGDGNDRKNLENIAKQLSLENKIKFTGNLPYEQIADVLAISDLGVSPIPPIEPFLLSSPLKVFEYLAAGIPVIGNEEILDQKMAITLSGGGIVVPYQVEAFAEAMMFLLDSPELSKQMKISGRDWIINNRDYKKLAIEIEKSLRELLINSKEGG